MIARYQYKRLVVASGLIAVMLLLSWLLDPLSSPLGFQYIMDHLYLLHFFGDLNTIPGIAAVLASQNPHNPNTLVGWLVFLLQWGVIGYGLGALIFRKPKKFK